MHKKFVAIPLEATPGGDVSKFDRTTMTMTAVTYDDMRPGCYDRDARIKDFELNWVDGSLPFPTFPRFCGQTFYEADDKELALACVQAYNDWMVEEWCEPVGRHEHPALPHAAVGRRARGGGDPAQRRRAACARSASASCRTTSSCRASTPATGTRCSQVCNDTGVTLCMHIGSSSTNPTASPDAPERRRRHARVQQLDGVARRLAVLRASSSQFPKLKLAYSEGQIGWIPYALERADTVWEQHDAWQHSKELIPEPPSTYYYGRDLRLLHRRPRTACTSLDEVGEDNICFETDYPHTDTTWPNSKEYVEKMLADFDDEHRLQGAARQRDPHARARPRLTSQGATASAP